MSNAIYDPLSRQWLFSHQRSRRRRIFSTTPEEKLVPSSVVPSNPGASKKYKKRQWWTRCLIHDAPEMGPAMAFVDNYLEESQLITANTAVSDPAIGRLLAFGIAKKPDYGGNSESKINVAAYACGETGSELAISPMRYDDRRVAGSKGVTLSAPRVVPDLPESFHIQFASPIRQICFAGNPYQTNEAKGRIAIRTSGSTQIFKVTSHYQDTRRKFAIGLDHLVTLTPLTSGGVSHHADVAFNPWYENQAGTIDGNGNWRVWDMNNRKPLNRNIKHTAGGRVTVGDEERGDGWGRFAWGGDLNTVMACDRTTPALFDIRTNTASPSIALPFDRNRNWILDLQRGVQPGGHDAFILTSSDITWTDIRQPGRALLSWPHHRHRDDVSMYLDLFRMDNVTTAVVSSRMNFLTTYHQFSRAGIQEIPTVLNEPFRIPSPFPSPDPSKGVINLAFLPAHLQFRNGATGPATQYRDQDINFLVGISIDKSLAITQRIYSTDPDFQVLGTKFTSSISITEDEEMEEVDAAETGLQNIFTRRADLSEAYDAIFNQGDEVLLTVQDGDTANTVEGYCTRLMEQLATRAELGVMGVSSLIEFRAPSLLFDNLPDLETAISALLSSPAIKAAYESKSLIPPYILPSLLLSSPPLSISSLYKSLIATHVTPLPASTPLRVRLRRERLARLIATDLYLASSSINVLPTAEQLTPPTHHTPHQPSQSWPTDETPLPEPLLRIRAYAHVQKRIVLSEGFGRVLSNWNIGEDPSSFEFFMDPEEGVPRYRKDRRKIRKGKERVTGAVGAAGLDVFGASQPPELVAEVFTQAQSQGFGSQALSQSHYTMGQVEKGKHVGRKGGKKRKTGF